MTKEPSKEDSIHEKDHKMGNLVDYLLMSVTTPVMWEEILGWAVAENIDVLQNHLKKSRKVLKKGQEDPCKAADYHGGGARSPCREYSG